MSIKGMDRIGNVIICLISASDSNTAGPVHPKKLMQNLKPVFTSSLLPSQRIEKTIHRPSIRLNRLRIDTATYI